MKKDEKKLLTVLFVLLAMVFALGTGVTAMADESAAMGAETRPLFNFNQPNSPFTYDKDTGVYVAYGSGDNTPRLSSIDAEMSLLKTDYSDDLIKFSYRYTQIYDTPLDGSDWYLYFTFRNLEGEAPCWVSQYSAHLLLFRDQMQFQLKYAGETAVTESVMYPNVLDEELNLIDNEFHTIEIEIDDETGDINIYRDKGEDNELLLEVSCYLEEKQKIGLLDEGGYSFSFRHCDVEMKDLYFFNSKNTEIDDEYGLYEELQNKPSEDEEQDSGEDTGKDPGEDPGEDSDEDRNDETGCGGIVLGSSILAACGLISLGGVVLFKKKENK